MAKENTFLKDLKERNLIDEREIAVVADVSSTNGNSGRGFVLLCGSTLRLFTMAGFAQLGDLVEELDLANAQVLKASSFVLHTSMKLKCGDHTYQLLGFNQAKKFIDAVKESCGT